MKCVYCPIDTRLNFHQVAKLLKEVQVCRSAILGSILDQSGSVYYISSSL